MKTFFLKKNQQGISIIEVIVVIFLVAILFTLIFLEVAALNTSRKQRYENIAYHSANKKMEALRATAVDSLPASGSISDSQLSQIPFGSGSFTVANYTGYTGIKEITVTVTWNDGSNKSVVIKTLAGSGGINP